MNDKLNEQHYSLSVRDRGNRLYKDLFFATREEATTKMVAEAGFMAQHDYKVVGISAHLIEVEDVDDPERGTEFKVREWPGKLED